MIRRATESGGGDVAFLLAGGFDSQHAAALWDRLIQGPGQDLVLEWMRLLDSGIEPLGYVASTNVPRGCETRQALVKFRGQGRIPLSSMGDGLTKLYHIALAVASTTRGVVLIDEFENGLHWSVQERLWHTLDRATRELGIQVFATTHSRDCIAGFVAAAEAGDESAATLYRLERDTAGVHAVDLPLLNVQAASRLAEEIRRAWRGRAVWTVAPIASLSFL